jgi:hypothetical protein
MKLIFLFATFLFLLDAGCPHQKSNTVSPSFNADSATALKPDSLSIPTTVTSKTKGRVSHQFVRNGCASVIISRTEAGEEFILIPRTPLENKFDKEGLEIFFNYHPVKIRQPEGCEKGVPAEITDVSLK